MCPVLPLLIPLIMTTVLSTRVITTYIRGTAFRVPVAALDLAPGVHDLTYMSYSDHPIQMSLIDNAATLLFPPPLRQQQSELGSLVHAIISTAARRKQRASYTVRIQGDDGTPVVDPTAAAATPLSTEWVDWMADDGATSLAVLPRPLVHSHNLLHRGIGVIILDSRGRVFVHQRSATKVRHLCMALPRPS